MRLADSLIKANKDFDLVVVPNANHGMGGAYGQRRLHDFFVRHLMGSDANSPGTQPDSLAATSLASPKAPENGPRGSQRGQSTSSRSTWPR